MSLAIPVLLLVMMPLQTTDLSSRDGHGGYSPQYDACMNSGYAAQGSDAGMVDCINAETGRQDDRLNRVYRALMARLSPARRQKLRIAEREWITSRVKNCRREAHDEEGGTLGTLIYSQCFLNEVKSRADFIEHYR